MAITINAPVQISASVWRLSWTSTGPGPQRIYRDGELLSTQAATSFDLVLEPGEAPLIEILDDPADSPLPGHPAFVTLGWAGDDDAVSYQVEQYVGAEWLPRAVVRNARGDWLTWRSGPQPDGSAQRWRILPVDAAGNTGTPREFTALLVRYPEPPAAELAYDAETARVTVA